MKMRLLLAFAWVGLSGGVAVAQPSAPAVGGQNCIDVQVGSAQSYDCLNAQLRQVARQAQTFSAGADAPYSATSPGNVTGQFNEDATRNRLGTNFGHSVTPERPVTSYPGAFSPPR